MLRALLALVLFASFPAPALAWLPDNPLARPAFEEILKLENSRDVGPRLQALAQDSDPLVRARALRALGRSQDPSLAGVMAAGLKDTDAAVRDEAALALGGLWDQGDDRALIEAFRDEKDPRVRDRIVEAVGRAGSVERGIPFLSALAAGPDSLLAQRACLGLGIMGNRKLSIKSATDSLVAASRSRAASVRWAAAFAFLRGHLEEARIYLKPLLKDPDPVVRSFAVRALAATKKEELGQPLADMIRDRDWRVRVEALKALPLVRAQNFWPVVQLAFDDENPLVVYTAIEQLGLLGANGGLELVDRTLNESDDWRYRAAAVVAKTRLEGDGALPLLERLKDASEWQIRAATAQALGLLTSNQAREILSAMAEDQNPKVLAEVASSLKNYPEILALTDLQGLLKSDDVVVLTNAAAALGDRSDRMAIPVLCDTYRRLKSPADVDAMTEILGALRKIVVPPDTSVVHGALTAAARGQAVKLIQEGLKDTDLRVGQAAAEALKGIDGKDHAAQITAPTPQFPLYLDEIRTLGNPKVRITTTKGTIVIELLPAEAPNTVANFLHLARDGFFANLTIHRVVPDFVTQDGDPRGDGWGGPGYRIRCEYNGLRYDTGMVGMALSGKDTGGSQYFITHSPNPHLDGRYTIFGRVVEGMNVVSKLMIGDVVQSVEMLPS